MISPEVGLETLPNCYIKMIETNSISKTSDRYVCHFVIKDQIFEDKSYGWYKDPYLYPHMQLMVVVSSNESLNVKLDEGSIDFVESAFLPYIDENNENEVRVFRNSLRNLDEVMVEDF